MRGACPVEAISMVDEGVVNDDCLHAAYVWTFAGRGIT
jgi:hypothetical protein